MEEEEKKAEAKRLEGVALLKYIVDQNKEEEKVKRKVENKLPQILTHIPKH